MVLHAPLTVDRPFHDPVLTVIGHLIDIATDQAGRGHGQPVLRVIAINGSIGTGIQVAIAVIAIGTAGHIGVLVVVIGGVTGVAVDRIRDRRPVAGGIIAVAHRAVRSTGAAGRVGRIVVDAGDLIDGVVAVNIARGAVALLVGATIDAVIPVIEPGEAGARQRVVERGQAVGRIVGRRGQRAIAQGPAPHITIKIVGLCRHGRPARHEIFQLVADCIRIEYRDRAKSSRVSYSFRG